MKLWPFTRHQPTTQQDPGPVTVSPPPVPDLGDEPRSTSAAEYDLRAEEWHDLAETLRAEAEAVADRDERYWLELEAEQAEAHGDALASLAAEPDSPGSFWQDQVDAYNDEADPVHDEFVLDGDALTARHDAEALAAQDEASNDFADAAVAEFEDAPGSRPGIWLGEPTSSSGPDIRAAEGPVAGTDPWREPVADPASPPHIEAVMDGPNRGGPASGTAEPEATRALSTADADVDVDDARSLWENYSASDAIRPLGPDPIWSERAQQQRRDADLGLPPETFSDTPPGADIWRPLAAEPVGLSADARSPSDQVGAYQEDPDLYSAIDSSDIDLDAQEHEWEQAQLRAEIEEYSGQLTPEEAHEISARAEELVQHEQGCNQSVENCGTCSGLENYDEMFWELAVPAARRRLAAIEATGASVGDRADQVAYQDGTSGLDAFPDDLEVGESVRDSREVRALVDALPDGEITDEALAEVGVSRADYEFMLDAEALATLDARDDANVDLIRDGITEADDARSLWENYSASDAIRPLGPDPIWSERAQQHQRDADLGLPPETLSDAPPGADVWRPPAAEPVLDARAVADVTEVATPVDPGSAIKAAEDAVNRIDELLAAEEASLESDRAEQLTRWHDNDRAAETAIDQSARPLEVS